MSVLLHAVLILASFAMLYPILWMISGSFRPQDELFGSSSLIPSSVDFGGYIRGWTGLQVSFGQFFWNSFFISVLATIGNVVGCSLAAFAFARLRFGGRNFWFALMLGTLMLPYHVVLIPQYILFLEMGWVNTSLPLIVPKYLATDAFFIFLMVQFFRGIPRELDEAAVMDGCSPFRIYWKIMLPLSAGSGNGCDLFLHLDLGRFLRSVDLSERHQHLHRATRPQILRGFHRQLGLDVAFRHVQPVAGSGLPVLPVLPAAAD